MKTTSPIVRANATFKVYTSEILGEIQEVKEYLDTNERAKVAANRDTVYTMLNVAEGQCIEFYDKACRMELAQDHGRRLCSILGSLLKSIAVVDGATGLTLTNGRCSEGSNMNTLLRLAGNDMLRLSESFKNA